MTFFIRLGLALTFLAWPAASLERLSLVTGADLDGALGRATCRADATLGTNVGHLAAAVDKAKKSIEADGRVLSASVHLGDLTGPSALGRYLVRGPEGPAQFVSLVSRVGYRSLLAGNVWFDTRSSRNAALAQAFFDDGVSMLAGNIRCVGRPDCDVLGRMRFPEVTREGVGLVGLLGDDVFPTIDPNERMGLEQIPVSEALRTQVSLAREAGARVVVALVHVSTDASLATAVGLAKTQGVDLVVFNIVKDAPGNLSVLEGAHDEAAVVVLGDAPFAATRIDFDLDESGRMQNVRAHRFVADEAEPSLEEDVRLVREAFCDAMGERLVDVLPREVSADEFLDYTLDVLRRAAHAEVGILNLDALDERGFPLKGAVSVADIFTALPFDDTVVRTTLSGARLKAIWQSPARHRLAWAGVTTRDGYVLVNDRRIEDAQNYSVVLPDYIARGGAGYIGAPVEYTTLEGRGGRALELRPAVLSAMRASDVAESLVGGHRLDLANSPRWTWSGALTLSANNTQLSNPASYDDARLARSIARAFKSEAAGRVDSHTRDHALRFTGRARYGQTRIAESGTTKIAETEDQIFGEMLYRLSAFQARLDQAWYAPLPYASVSVDTEFFKNDDAAFRRFELSTTLGLRMAPIKPLELKAGAGARRQMFDPEARTRLGLEVGYELPRFSPISMRGLPVDVESSVDYFVSDFAGDALQEGRFRVRLLLPLGGPLAFTIGFDVFAYKKGDSPFAIVSDATVGLTARLDGGRQQF